MNKRVSFLKMLGLAYFYLSVLNFSICFAEQTAFIPFKTEENTKIAANKLNLKSNSYSEVIYPADLKKESSLVNVYTSDIPNDPTDLVLSNVTEHSIDITWKDNSENETWFSIERKDGVDGTWAALSHGLDYDGKFYVNYYQDNNLDPNTEYCYRIRAFNGPFVYSNYSNIECTTTKEDATIKWMFQTGGAIHSCPAIGDDGTIYFGSDDHKLYALNPKGTKIWDYLTVSEVKTSPVISNFGNIYFCSNNILYAFTLAGDNLWEFVATSKINESPAISNDGTIYIVTEDNKLLAVNDEGKKKWEFNTEKIVNSSPIIGPDGTIYFLSNNKLLAVSKQGNKKWEYEGNMYQYLYPPALGKDGTIYIGSSGCWLYAISPNGTEKWKVELRTCPSPWICGWHSSSPVIGDDNTIYMYVFSPGDEDFKERIDLFAVSPNGKSKWGIVVIEGYFYFNINSPIIGNNGTIYVSTSEEKLVGIGNFYDSAEERYYRDIIWEGCFSTNFSSSLTMDETGIIYGGSNDGKLYAVYSQSESLADSPWPKDRKDLKNTGCSEVRQNEISYQIVLPNCTDPLNSLVVYEGDFMEGESCVFPPCQLPTQYAAFQPYYNAMINSELYIPKGALNENIELIINLEGVCKEKVLDDPETEDIVELFFLNIETMGAVTGSHKFLEYYYFNDGKEAVIKIPLVNIDPLLNLLNYDKDLLEPFFIANNLNPDFSGIRKEIDDTHYKIFAEHFSELRLGIVNAPTSLDNIKDLPKKYSLSQNYPNPFNPSTSITFTIQNSEDVELNVYDVLGNEVGRIHKGFLSSGEHSFTFDANELTSGVYFYRLKTSRNVFIKKMVLVK